MKKSKTDDIAYKTLKQRLQIENYTAYSKIGIKQDIYSTFYNIQHYSAIPKSI